MTLLYKIKASSKKYKYVDVYLLYPNLSKLEKRGNFTYFFANLMEIDKQLPDCTVFLSLHQALQYSRFLSHNHVILKAYVVEESIASHGHELTLKQGYLTKEQIHGCFPGWAKGLMYLKNPEFNTKQH